MALLGPSPSSYGNAGFGQAGGIFVNPNAFVADPNYVDPIITQYQAGLPTVPTQAPTQPDAAFVWAEGGARLTPEDIAARRQQAAAQVAAGMDYSPVGSWTQGLARVAQALTGALDERRLDRDAAANQAHSDRVLQALMGNAAGAGGAGGRPTLDVAMRAASDPYASADVREMGKFWMERMAPKPSTAQPYRWEDNAGNVWQLNPDGSVPNTPLFVDRAPKQMLAPSGQLITSTNPYTGGAPALPSGGPQVGDVVDDPRLANRGGGVGNGAGPFRP